MRAVSSALLLGLAVASPVWAFLPPAYDDAPIRAMQFLTRDHGVAVGDHGVVWQTLDGGRTWDHRKSGTRASLRAVSFADEISGWAVGRTELPGDAGSVGTVMRTQDGGLTWAETNTTALPGLNFVQFLNETDGVAGGDGNETNPSGLYATADAGKTWMPIKGPRTTSWTCGQFKDLSNGVLGGVWSKLSVLSRGQFASSDVDSLRGRAIRGVAFDGNRGVAVCDGGIILTTGTAGGTWAVSDTGLSAATLANLDFRGIARYKDTLWIVGRPGSVILKSTDFGKTWQLCRTNWNGPLQSVWATSADEVYAAGELGAILKSKDGGQSWTLQRCGARRAAVLFAHSTARAWPMDALAAVGGRDGYLTTALGITSADPATADLKRCPDEFRHQAAVRTAGGASAETGWAFPLAGHQADANGDALLKTWDAQLDGQAEAQLVRQLVLALRIWTPEVVVSDLVSSQATPVEQLVLACAKKAFKLADDPKCCPEQIDELGLKPFAPKKIYALAPATATDAHVKMENTVFARTLVNTVQGHAEPAFALLGEGLTPPAVRNIRLVSHRSPGSETHPAVTTGLEFGEGGSARRVLPKFDASLEDIFEKAKTASDSRRTLEAVVMAATTNTEAEKALSIVYDKLRKLPEDVACKAAVGLGRQLAAQGKWEAAREMYLIVASKYLGYAESAEAVRWLGRYYSSREARMRADKNNAVVSQYSVATTLTNHDGTVQQTRNIEPVISRQAFKLTDAEATQAWCQACLEMERKLKSFNDTYAQDPVLGLTTLSARRSLNLTGDAAEQIQLYFKQHPGALEQKPGVDLWRDCYAAEWWLANRAAVAVQPKPLAFMPKVTTKPFLDGKLDDDCWKEMKPIDLATGSGELKGYSTKGYFTYDEDYLYFAVQCLHPEGQAVAKAEKRKRDDDLRGFDRVDLLLDLDRDYQTYYRFQIDQRGCVAEDCWGDASWNPRYFVAVESTATGWVAELAVPRSELTNAAFKPGQTWGMNLTRVLPGKGVQTWSGPADANPRPEGLGLMQFHTEIRK